MLTGRSHLLVDSARNGNVRKRGVVLSEPGLAKLRSCPSASVTFEHLAERVSLSAQTVARVWSARAGVDRRTLERVFMALGLELTRADYAATRPVAAARALDVARPLAEPASAPPRCANGEFIGRKSELAAIERQLRIARLMTITGPGGIGKSRLALAAAERFSSASPFAFVDVARCSSADVAEATIRQALATQRPPALLIADACEALLPACARLVRAALAADPALRVIATSREPLEIPGESELRLRGLTVPIDGHDRDERVFECSAVELFVASAKLARGNLEIGAERAPVVASIVRSVEGNPLAIERAAARLKMFSYADLAARLDSSLSILNDDIRALPARRPSLRDIFERSYALLSARDQAVLRRISVFVGGWTADAAGAVCEDSDWSVSGAVARLITKSLVLVDDDVAGRRYRLPAISREYAHEKLAACGGVVRTARDAVGYFCDLAASAEGAFAHGQTEAFFARLRAEQINLEHMLRWALQEGHEAELGGTLAADLAPYWVACGRFDDGIRWLRLAYASLDCRSCSSQLQLRITTALANLLLWNGLPDQADAIARDAARKCGTHHQTILPAELRFVAARAARSNRRLNPLRGQLEEYVRACRVHAPERLGEALVALAEFEMDDQNADTALAFAREGLARARGAQQPFAEALALSVCARIADAHGEHEHAVAGGDRARALLMTLGNAPLAVAEIARTAAYRARAGRMNEAFVELRRARTLARPSGAEIITLGEGLAACLALACQPGEAVFVLASVETARREAGISRGPGGEAKHADLVTELSAICGTRFATRWLAGLRTALGDAIDAVLSARLDDAPPARRTIAN